VDYSVEMDMYEYWCWQYYPDWIVWYQNQKAQPEQALEEPLSHVTADGLSTTEDPALSTTQEPIRSPLQAAEGESPDNGFTTGYVVMLTGWLQFIFSKSLVTCWLCSVHDRLTSDLYESHDS